MNINETPAAYGVLNPHRIFNPAVNGEHYLLGHVDRPGYLDLDFLNEMAGTGSITITRIKPCLDASRVHVYYTINK
jgi:hypothetical protein